MTMVSQPISTTISFKEKVVVVSFNFCFVKKIREYFVSKVVQTQVKNSR
jgi:hypothetical protein